MTYKVYMSDVLFDEMGLELVTWGEPDEDGFYTPTIRSTWPEREVILAVRRKMAWLLSKVNGLIKTPPWPLFGAESHEAAARAAYNMAIEDVLDLLDESYP